MNATALSVMNTTALGVMHARPLGVHATTALGLMETALTSRGVTGMTLTARVGLAAGSPRRTGWLGGVLDTLPTLLMSPLHGSHGSGRGGGERAGGGGEGREHNCYGDTLHWFYPCLCSVYCVTWFGAANST
jgi:hypothetical protein